MKTFAECDVFNRRTGKKEGTEMKPVGLLCDFCGAVIDTEGYNQGEFQQVKFEIREVGGSEQSYYYYDGTSYGIPSDSGVDINKVFEEHESFDYCCDDEAVSCSRFLLVVPEGEVPTSLESVMQQARLRVVAKLLSQGRSPKELGIEQD